MSVAKALKAADKARREGRFEQAEALFADILVRYPQNVRARAGLREIENTPFSLQLAENERGVAAQILRLIESANRLEAVVQAENALLTFAGSFAFAQVIAEFASKMDRYDLAVRALRQALSLRPGHARTLYNLAICLNRLLDHEGALDALEKAVQERPDHDASWRQLKATALKCSRESRALEAIEALCDLDPESADNQCERGDMLARLGRYEEAQAAYAAALAVDPEHLDSALASRFQPNPILASTEMIDHGRAGLEQALEVVKSHADKLDHAPRRLCEEPYFLAYHGRNNAPLKAEISQTLRHSVHTLSHDAPHLQSWTGPGARIRLGICSEYLSRHTIGHLFGGFVEGLDPQHYEIVLIRLDRSKQDDVAHRLSGHAARTITLRGDLAQQQAQIAELKLDVLFYPDIGMNADTYQLAFARLAPVQLVSWGHPDTTGIDTLDYFLSARSIEPDQAQSHYSERLVRLERLPCHYAFEPLAPEALDRTAFGLPETGRLYGCPQTLFKFHPDFDAVLEAIIEADPEGRIVLVEGRVPSWVRLLKARWARTAPRLLEACIFVPPQRHAAFLALMAHMDVLLDPVHFGSGNTLYEAMAMGVPIVTWPGEFMRGRIVAGAYSQMGIEDAPIAPSLDDYARTAVSLAQDRERRAELSGRLKQAARRDLFNDDLALEEFDIFIRAALSACQQGARLSADWRSGLAEKSRDLKESVS